MADMIDFVELRCTTGGHNKYYQVWLEKVVNGWLVQFKYGAIGATGLVGTKTPQPKDEWAAKKIYESIKDEKLGKGYVTYKSGTTGKPKSMAQLEEAQEKKVTQADYFPFASMQPTKAKGADLATYLKDPAWAAQQKMNGRLLRLYWDGTAMNKPVLGFNKTGGLVEVPDNISEAIKGAGEFVMLDGEIIDGVYHCFDALRIGDAIYKEDFKSRFTALMNYVDAIKEKCIRRVKTAFAASDKQEIYTLLKKSGQEGLVFKKLDTPYAPGKTENLSKAVSIKIKFWKEISAELLKWNDKNSIQVSLKSELGSQKMVIVGNVTVPEKYKQAIKDAGDGCIVRVRYLYATAADKLYQPSLDPDDDGYVVRLDAAGPDFLSDLAHEGDLEGEEPFRSIMV